MTAAGDPKGMVPTSRLPIEARKVMAYGLESLSCFVPKASHREEVDYDATTESNATVFPLKESYSKNVQNPHSNRYWDNAAKDYRHALLNEIAEEEAEEIKSNNNSRRPKIRRIPEMPPRSHSEIKEAETDGFTEYQEWNRGANIAENELRDEPEHFHQSVWEADHLEDIFYHPYHDVHYNAILDVQEDEDRRRNLETIQTRNHIVTGGEEGQLRTDIINQEYLRLKAISDKHEWENVIRKERMNIPRNKEQELRIVSGQSLSFDRPQRSIEGNASTNKDAVFDSRYSYDRFSVSNLSSPTIIHEKDTRLTALSTSPWDDSKESHRRSASFNSRWRSFGESVFANKDIGLDSRHSQPKSQREIYATKPASIATSNDVADSSRAMSMSTLTMREAPALTNETLPKSSSFESVENEFMSKITVVESQHSLDPIFVSTESSPPKSAYEAKELYNATSASSRGTEVILEEDIIAQERSQQRRFASFNRHRGAHIESAVIRKGIASDSRLNHHPTVVSESSAAHMSLHNKRELATEPTQYFRDPTKRQGRKSNQHSTFYGSSHVDMNSPAMVSELSHKSGSSIRPITPSPKASGTHKQQFEISPERDVRCDKGKRHQFYEGNPFIPAYSDSVIIGRPISPENGKGYGTEEHGTIDGLSPVTCSGSQFRNNIFSNTARQGEENWGDELVDHELIERSNETVRVQHLSSKREVNPAFFQPPSSSQACMPLINKKLRSVVDRYHQKLKESSRTNVPQAKPGDGENI